MELIIKIIILLILFVPGPLSKFYHKIIQLITKKGI